MYMWVCVRWGGMCVRVCVYMNVFQKRLIEPWKEKTISKADVTCQDQIYESDKKLLW